jgi:hypothetical protein
MRGRFSPAPILPPLQIRETAQSSLERAAQPSEDRAGVVYADTLTLLYEALARCLETNQPMVETYYGPPWMPFLVRELQTECDEQCGRVLEHLHAERLLDHKVRLTESEVLYQPRSAGSDCLHCSQLSLCHWCHQTCSPGAGHSSN